MTCSNCGKVLLGGWDTFGPLETPLCASCWHDPDVQGRFGLRPLPLYGVDGDVPFALPPDAASDDGEAAEQGVA